MYRNWLRAETDSLIGQEICHMIERLVLDWKNYRKGFPPFFQLLPTVLNTLNKIKKVVKHKLVIKTYDHYAESLNINTQKQ